MPFGQIPGSLEISSQTKTKGGQLQKEREQDTEGVKTVFKGLERDTSKKLIPHLCKDGFGTCLFNKTCCQRQDR